MSDLATAETAAPEAQADARPARFIWYELMTSDQDAAIAFYRAVVGWNAADHRNPAMGDFRYTILSAGDRGIGGIMQLSDGMRTGGARPGWIGYIHASDTDAKARQAVEAGARMLMEPGDIPDVGRFALLADPGGAPFYLLTPLPRDDVPPAAAPGTPGHVSWHELAAGNGQAAAFGFYSGLFGWETMQEMAMGPMGTYRIFGVEGEQLGGMMDKPASAPDAAWLFYFNVEAIDAAAERVRAHGGEVLREPHQVPDGSWIIHGRDPQGATFALVAKQR